MSLKPLSAPASNTVLADCSADQQPVESEATVDGLPDGAYLIAGVTVTENGEVTQYSRDQIKIYTQGRFMYAFNNAVIDLTISTLITHLLLESHSSIHAISYHKSMSLRCRNQFF